MALHQLSLRQFATTASRLYEDNTGDFLSFVLSGEANDDNGDVQQYAVNALQGASPIIHDELEFSRDIDSIIGVTQTLPFKVPLSIFPIAPFSETLKKNSHITQPVLNPNGSHIAVELSKIPNFAFFKFGGRHVTRIFCPEANSSGWSGEPTVPTDLLKKFYEQCLRPAVEEVVIGGTVHWLPSYEAVYRRSRDHNSQLHFSSTDIPLESIPLFETALVTKMALIPKFNNFFFGHEIRGVKGATRHHPRDNVDREAAFDKVCDVLDPTRLNFGDWMVDVAIEVRWPQRVLLWKTDAHYKVVQRALGCDDDEARALMRSRHKTSVDLCAQLKELGGFRSHPGTLGLNRGVLYINVYTTDKAATYQLHQGDFERRRYTDVGPARLERLSRSVETTRDTFFDCAGVNSEQTGFDGATRFEIRVPLLSVNKTHYKLSRQFIDDTMVAFPTKTWWVFKAYRAQACVEVFLNHLQNPGLPRAWSQTLTLGLITLYIFNGLIYRPREGRHESYITRSAAALEEDAPDRDLYYRGLYFIDSIRQDRCGILRMSGSHRSDLQMLASMMRLGTWTAVEQLFVATGRAETGGTRTNPTRTNNRRTGMTGDIATLRDEVDDESIVEWGLAEIVLQPLATMAGDDVPMIAEGDEEDEEHGGLETILANIWTQFPNDLISLSPNRRYRQDNSYCLLDADRRREVRHSTFRTADLFGVFPHAHVIFGGGSSFAGTGMERTPWDANFDRLFPSQVPLDVTRLQGFKKARYFGQWVWLLARLRPNDIAKVRRRLKKEFDTLLWMPRTESDRMWKTTKSAGAGAIWYPSGTAKEVSVVLVFRKHAQVKVGGERADRDEEDEDIAEG